MAFAPFGIEFGAPPPDDFEWADEFYSSGAPPSPHRDFGEYVCVSGSEGVGRILAVTDQIDNDREGITARATFARIVKQLAKYGGPTFHDQLSAHALWTEDHEWSDSIVHGERTYAAVWSADTNSLPSDLDRILLNVLGHDHGGLKIMLCYTGTLYADIEAEIDAASADVL